MIIEDDKLNLRSGLPEGITRNLLSPSKEEWKYHSNYSGMASIFVDFHSMLNSTMSSIQRQLEVVLDGAGKQNLDSGLLRQMSDDMQSFYAAIHRHHEVEDHIYFPKFRHLFPSLSKGLTLLDKDHVILMPKMEMLLDYSYQMASADDISYSLLGRVYGHIQETRKLLSRHLTDEEDIIIPMFLKS